MTISKTFYTYLNTIEQMDQREKVETLLLWIEETFPELEPIIKWNQPMFSDHGTYIIGFSTSKQHIAVSPEVATLQKFESELKNSGYSYTNNIFRIKWHEAINFELIQKMIEFQIEDKKDYTKFWR